MVNSQGRGGQDHGQYEEASRVPTFIAVQPSSSEGRSKRYVCTHENCNKAFTRSDHLQRHSLNHNTVKSTFPTCSRCSLSFTRPDLLDRHMARHRQKDDEAGGYGLGVMETRKRMWRDADGNIVAKRPTLPNNNPAVASQRRNPSSESRQQGTTSMIYEVQHDTEPLSPPRSMTSPDSNGSGQQQMSTITHTSEDQWNAEPFPSFENNAQDMCEFLADSSWDSQPSQSSMTMNNIPYDDVFNPDTASSFNMPFTTETNYNWLFDVNRLGQDLRIPLNTDPMQNRAYQSMPSQSSHAMSVNNNFNGNLSRQLPAQDILSSNVLPVPSQNSAFSQSNAASQMQMASDRQRHVPNEPVLASSTADSTQTLSPEDESSSSGNFSGQYTSSATSRMSVSEDQPRVRPQNVSNRPEQVSAIDPLRTFRPASRARNLPVVDEISRKQILDLIVQAGPKTPEGAPITQDHPLLSLSSLQNYCDLFFSRFNVTYPLLHQATFDPSKVETLLLVSVLLLGATYGDKAGHRLAVCIHDVFRAQIFQSTAFNAQPELWILQTILLVECFGKSRAGAAQHDMAHLFHGLLINLIRRSDCQTVHQPSFERGELESNWRKFVNVEQRKRLALLCFLWDTQHAVLFSQSLCMSAFELRICLPCNPTTWEAESAEDWYMNFKAETETSFLSILKVYANPGSTTPPVQLNALSRLLILHGLMSISWDMKRREQTSLGFIGHNPQERRTRLAESYDKWKADFDTYCMSMTLSLKDNAALKSDFTRFSTASIAIYHAAHIILNVEILDLQIYAGARHIIGRPVTRVDYDRSRRILNQWTKPDSAAAVKAAWHAAHLLRDGIMNLDNWDVNDVFHYPWCLYLATLTCWGFHFAGSDKTDQEQGVGDMMRHDDIVWDAQAEMNALVSGMTSVTPEGLWRMVGKYATSGLTAVMAKHLSSVRWAVVHEGMKVLKGLVAERTINEYESLLR